MTPDRILSWTPAAIVFDCDGTLMDTERHWEVARELTASDFGVGTEPDFARRAKGLHYTECGVLMAREAGRPELAGRLTERLLSSFRTLAAETPRTMPGARELVANAAKFAPLAVASNCPLEVVEECLVTADLRRYFDHIVVPDSATRPKPHPDVYLAAARYCGAAAAETLAVEDSHCGVQAATRAGLRVLGVGPWPGEETAAMVDLWVAALDEPRIFEWASERVARRLRG
ncbi:HAD family hydrolase [Actinacidiphila bryophytorum]|uniref:Haloacid dehalogenase superfamily, subfamily IA, variant 3 with third motif having DD or ED n=1 Tax=Actinacidiphila bryophytorum TaxID=1436133 RepID=A0A9W4H3Y1_9ACTN|nr:HAD family phosphatase [Actinacidiphila bryophytorum]MBM9435927.1 HAD family phosphatase [Actinacidiphila bryophytorum]MBN6541510.1 HAD family phosphatase [Actinacidiphila bryophytorum]CAG7649521.1 Haloacid dehalogenase superfamily, subfamily IA, variant 3 with third motif having DD or ED [Actinacidiphila bryophytorum]